MNALANSQELELKKFLEYGFGYHPPVTFHRYTGQESEESRKKIITDPPDILLTNYVMLELILTRPHEKKLVAAAQDLRFLVFDELHTYRGRQGADVAMLIRRLRNAVTPAGSKSSFQCIGTSATLAGPGTFAEQRQEVATPRIDLANEDMVRAHVNAIWLSESGLDLRQSLSELLDITGQKPSLELVEHVSAHFADQDSRIRARNQALLMLASMESDLAGCGWYSWTWLDNVLSGLRGNFEQACSRWRGLYHDAVEQRDHQNSIIANATLSQNERKQAEVLRAEAQNQIEILLAKGSRIQSDFYSYRYFAGEGFLPGYNFPRLPVSAYIPGTKGKKKDQDYVSRPRFLAISEFGPGSFIYHEGSRYVISRVSLPVGSGGESQPDQRLHNTARCSSLYHGDLSHHQTQGSGEQGQLCDP